MRSLCFKTSSILVLSLYLASCGTLSKNLFSKDDIEFLSEPAGADVYLNQVKICQTPCRWKPEKDQKNQLVEFKKDPYPTVERKIFRGWFGPFWVNFALLYFAPIGFGIDWATGHWARMKPYVLKVNFDEQEKTDEQDEEVEENEVKTQELSPLPASTPAVPQIINLPQKASKKKEIESEEASKSSVDEKVSDHAPADEDPLIDAKDSPKQKPLHEKTVIQINEIIPDGDLEEQVRMYYHPENRGDIEAIKKRLQLILGKMLEEGQRLDIEEAVRLDFFNQN